MKHTVGPWKANPSGFDAAGRPDGWLVEGDTEEPRESIAEVISKEDALLIAAAPDLLEAAELFLGWNAGDADKQGHRRKAVEALRAAVDKAWGRVDVETRTRGSAS